MRDFKQLDKLINHQDFLIDDPELKEIIVNYLYGDVFNHGNLDILIRELILIVVNTTNHTLLALKRHVIEAIEVGLDPIRIKEAVYQCTPYIGIGKVEEALLIINEVFKEKNIQLPLANQAIVNEATRFEKGFNIQSVPFGKENIQANHDNAPKELKHIQNYLSEYCFGDFYTRNGLNIQERELITFVMIATLGGCENQLRAHIQGNLNVGNSREMLIETISQCQPYIGFPRTLNAIAIINEVTKK